MGFNKRKIEDARRQAAEQEAAARRATEQQILETDLRRTLSAGVEFTDENGGGVGIWLRKRMRSKPTK
jgi:hypothetical protein